MGTKKDKAKSPHERIAENNAKVLDMTPRRKKKLLDLSKTRAKRRNIFI